MNEMFFKKARFNPSIAVPIRVTVTMPITIPRVVRIDRILLARMAAQEMPNPSLSSAAKFTISPPVVWTATARTTTGPPVAADRAVYHRTNHNDPPACGS